MQCNVFDPSYGIWVVPYLKAANVVAKGANTLAALESKDALEHQHTEAPRSSVKKNTSVSGFACAKG
ncbi:MAG: hypothetical protein ACJ8FY_26795 [Gemmataceae bacterium]